MPENDGQTDANDSVVNIDFSEDGNTQAEQPTAPEESSTEEPKADAEEPKDTETEADTDESDDEEQSDDAESDEPDESDETDEEPKQKGKNNAQNRIRSLANENRQLKQQVESLTAQAYQPQTAEQLQEQGLDETSAQVEAMRQEQAIRDYNAQVVQTTQDLNMESMQVIHDMPVFDPQSKEYDKEFHEKVNQLYTQVAGIQTDPRTGNIVNANVLPYDFYKSFDEIRKGQIQKGEIRGKQNARKTMAAAEVPSQTSTKKETDDPVLKVLLAGLDD